MTLDITIGKIVEENNELNVEMCPKSETNICNPNSTLWANESYRSGGSDLWEFWEHHCNSLYFSLREHPHTNDKDIAKLSHVIDEINLLPDDLLTQNDNDRMLWFKYWSNKAVELYGDNAGIEFC